MKIKIPEAVTLPGISIKVVQHDDLQTFLLDNSYIDLGDEERYFGIFDAAQLIIHLDKTVHPDLLENVFFHELGHAMAFLCRIDEDADSHAELMGWVLRHMLESLAPCFTYKEV